MKPERLALGETWPEPPEEVLMLIDNLQPGSVEEVDDSIVADIRLKYGEEGRDDVLNHVARRIAFYGDRYRQEAGALLACGQPNVAIPPDVIEEPATYKMMSYHSDSGQLKGWLNVAAEHQPQVAEDAAVATVNHFTSSFNKEAFASALAELEQREDQGPRMASCLKAAAQQLVESTANDLSDYTTDPEITRQFMASDLFTTLASLNTKIQTHHHLVRLEGAKNTIGYSEDFKELTRLVERSMATKGYSFNELEALEFMAEHAPFTVKRLLQQYPDKATYAGYHVAERLLLGADVLTEPQNALLQQIESDLLTAGDVWTYGLVLRAYFMRDGSIPPEKVANIATLLESRPPTMNEPQILASVLAARFMPTEKLVEVAAEHSSVTLHETAKLVAIRRLAAEGAVDQALALAARRSATLGTYDHYVSPIRSVLTIYEETGNPDHLELANQTLAAFVTELGHPPSEYLQHEFAARRYVAARCHGYEALATEAAEEMEGFHQHVDPKERSRALQLTTQLFLDSGEVDIAEQFAVRLYDQKINESSVAFDVGPRTLLAVSHAYLVADRPHDALRCVQQQLLTPPFTARSLDALALLASNGEAPLPDRYENHLNPLTDITRLRT